MPSEGKSPQDSQGVRYLPIGDIDINLSITGLRAALRHNPLASIIVAGVQARTNFDLICERFQTACDIAALAIVLDRHLLPDEWYVASLDGENGRLVDAYGSRGAG